MERDGHAAPEEIKDEPTIPLQLLIYLEAFYDLDTERAHGTSLVRIPWSRIVNYGMHYGFDIEELLFFIKKLDGAHLSFLNEKVKAGAGSSGPREMVQRAPRPD